MPLENPNRQFQESIGTSSPTVPEVISTSDLAPTPSLNMPKAPAPTNYAPQTAASLESLLAAYNATTPQEQTASTLSDEVMKSMGILSTESTRRRELETQAGLPDRRKELQGSINRLRQLQAEQLALPMLVQDSNVEGRMVTRSGVAPIQASRQRTLAIEQLRTSAFAQALVGDIQTAQADIDSAIKAEFEPERNRLEMLKTAYDMNQDVLARIDKKRSETLGIAIQERERLLRIDETNRKEIYDIGLTARKYGADDATINAIVNARTREEALAAAGGSLQDPMAKQELINARLNATLTRQRIDKEAYELNLLKKYGGMTPSQYADHLKAEQKAIKDAQDEAERNRLQAQAFSEKIGLIDGVLNHKALDSVVGSTFFTRGLSRNEGLMTKAGSFFTGGLLFRSHDEFMGADDVVASVEQFISQEFIENLVSAKAAGATFGALTKAEQDALTAAANRIGQTRIRQGGKDEGRVIGYDMSEAAFKSDLQTVKQLTQMAYQKATGNMYTPEEQEFWDNLLMAQSTASFDPSY